MNLLYGTTSPNVAPGAPHIKPEPPNLVPGICHRVPEASNVDPELRLSLIW